MNRIIKHLFLAGLIVLFSGALNAQEAAVSSSASTELKVQQLIDKKADYNKRTFGEYDGYRIKIHFGIDRGAARDVKSRFLSRYADLSAYEDYEQPNFVITVGDFKTKLAAFEALKRIQGDFPNAFIIKSKIRPMKL